MATYRSYSIAFKRQLVEEYLSGGSLKALSRRHDVGRALIRLWARKAEAGDFADERVTAELLREYEARVEALERLAGKQAARTGIFKKSAGTCSIAAKRDAVHHGRPAGLGIARGCRLMGLARSTYYDQPARAADDTALVEALFRICDAFEFYGYRRVGAALRQ